MKAFQKQLEAMASALLLIERLPLDTVWSLTCTNDDDADNPSVLNVYADEEDWAKLACSLRLPRIVDRSTRGSGDQFVSYRVGSLYVSFIEEEKKPS